MLTCLVPVLFTFYIQGVLKLKKNNSGAKGLIAIWYEWLEETWAILGLWIFCIEFGLWVKILRCFHGTRRPYRVLLPFLLWFSPVSILRKSGGGPVLQLPPAGFCSVKSVPSGVRMESLLATPDRHESCPTSKEPCSRQFRLSSQLPTQNEGYSKTYVSTWRPSV